MARPPRKQFANALYHVTSRGNGRAHLFFGDDDCRRFLSQLQDNLENYQVVLYAYVLMPNHYHLLVRTPQANLSRFMQRLNTSYALYSRYKHQKPGHRLEGRYKAKLVQDDAYVLTLTRYLHLNPVKVQAMTRIGKGERVRYLEGYEWSSYRGYVAERAQEDWVCYDILKLLNMRLGVARRRYRAYVYGCMMEDDRSLRAALDRSGHGIGDEEFIRELEQDLRERKTGTDRDRDVDYPVERIAVDRIDEAVAEEFAITVEGLKANGHAAGVGMAKAVAMELACRFSSLTQREIGALHGGVSSQAVSLARKRAKAPSLANRLARLTERLQAKTSSS